MKKQFYIIITGLLIFTACKPDLKQSNTPSNGGLDFSRYVAVGNSLTAGYSSNSLSRTGQLNSYPAILASVFKTVGGGDFKIPLLPGDAGYPSPRLVLVSSVDCKGVTGLGPASYSGTMDTAGSAANISSQGPFNNVGVPGIRTIDYLTPGYGFVNPYSKRFFADLTAPPLTEALRIPATFFTLWLGNNDVLGYATGGGNGSASGQFPSDISPVSLFKTVYDSVVNAMTAHGAKGACMNIPDVTAIPFFTTVPINGLVLDATAASQLNAAYASAGITFHPGANNFVIADAAAPGGVRQIKTGEYILLTAAPSIKCSGWGSTTPIPANSVLDATEVANVKNATAAFNQIIQDDANRKNLAYVDINGYLKTITTGITFNGNAFNAQFVSGGAFSLDGVHLTPRGYAIVANYILLNINKYYGSTLPYVDVNSYNGLQFP